MPLWGTGTSGQQPPADIWVDRRSYRELCKLERYQVTHPIWHAPIFAVPSQIYGTDPSAHFCPGLKNVSYAQANGECDDGTGDYQECSTHVSPPTWFDGTIRWQEGDVWPACVVDVNPQDLWDKGFRYPTRYHDNPFTPGQDWKYDPMCSSDCEIDIFQRQPEQPATLPSDADHVLTYQPRESWPICVSEDEAVVISDPFFGSFAAPGGPPTDCADMLSSYQSWFEGPIDGVTELHEVGRCEASAHYYERLVASNKVPAETFYSFVQNADECTIDPQPTDDDPTTGPCSQDVYSAVKSCKSWCETYFDRLTFDGASWVDCGPSGDQCTHTPIGEEVWDFLSAQGGTADGAYDYLLRRSADSSEPLRLVNICKDMCGPPYAYGVREKTDTGPVPLTNTHATPPWVSSFTATKKDPAESNNHWHYVTFGRWNPNQRLDGWLRSFTVNKDKPDAPAGECRKMVDWYCDRNHGGSAACKGRAIPAPLPIPEGLWRYARLKEGDPAPGVSAWDHVNTALVNDGTSDNLGFCAIFFDGNLLCDDACAAFGADSEDQDKIHMCGGSSEPQGQLPRLLADAGGLSEEQKVFECAATTAACELHWTESKKCRGTSIDYETEELEKCRFAAFVGDVTLTSTSLALTALHYDSRGYAVTSDAAQGKYEVFDANGTLRGEGDLLPSPDRRDWTAAAPATLNVTPGNAYVVRVTLWEELGVDPPGDSAGECDVALPSDPEEGPDFCGIAERTNVVAQ